jgi:3-deoxy-D-manno-octulosonate 8-phosphate phosphatase (KDO 8-P phosphatase)
MTSCAPASSELVTSTPGSEPASLPEAIARRAQRVRLLTLDVDGVLTDGRLYYASGAEEAKAFHIQDGLGIKLLQRSGMQVALITGRRSPAVERRAQELGIALLFQGIEDKRAAFEQLLNQLHLQADEAACMGDDLPDLPLLRRCALAASVPDAPAVVRQHVHYVTRRRGGEGAVREVCDLLMRAQGTLDGLLREYLA